MKKKSMEQVCRNCLHPLPEKTQVCPVCGANNARPVYKKWWFWLIIVLVMMGAAVGNGADSGPAKGEGPSITTPSDGMETASPEVFQEKDIPKEYRSALTKAESYSDIMHMSKASIYDQLVSEYEGFSEEAAQYAIDYMEADWNANALAKAEIYSETMHMSKARIYDQLTSEFGEKFTPEQAQYAIDHVEADWNANALATAENYQEMLAMSPSAIYNQLISDYGEKFTREQAQYAIDHLS